MSQNRARKNTLHARIDFKELHERFANFYQSTDDMKVSGRRLKSFRFQRGFSNLTELLVTEESSQKSERVCVHACVELHAGSKGCSVKDVQNFWHLLRSQHKGDFQIREISSALAKRSFETFRT